MPVFCSSDVWPIIREYERTATATIHGYVQPVVARYLAALQTALKQAGVAAEAMVTKSNGGVMTAELGKSACLQMLLSGTAAGVIGAGFVARQAGLDKVLSLDIGGTSADVAIIVDGTPTYGTGEMVGDFPIYIPTVSVTSIGDGGGSIAAVSEFGILTVGPESAGSTPGPACYGRGGTRPTMTDAFAVCGVIGHGNIGYDAVAVDVDKARAAVGTIAAKLGRGLEQAAEAIIQVAVSGMYREVGKLASRQGIDPRDFTLLAFGGAGPMLGCFLARELGMRQVLIPTAPGVLSALGGLVADVKNDFISTAYYPLSAAELPRLKADFDRLARRAAAWITDEQKFAGPYVLQPAADMRYQGQSFEIEVPLQLDWIAAGDWQRIAAAFHAQHDRLYGHSSAGDAGVTWSACAWWWWAPRRSRSSRRSRGAAARPRPPSRSRSTSTAPGAACRSTGGPTWSTAIVSAAPASWRRRIRRSACRKASPARSTRTATFSCRWITLRLGNEGTRDAHRPGHAADLRQSRPGGRRQHGVHAVPHGALDLREGNRGLHHRPGHARRHDLRQPARPRRHLVHRPRLRQCRCAWSATTGRATSASPTIPTAASCAPTRPTCTCGSRSSGRTSWSPSRSATSTTPTSAARCRHRCRGN